MSVNLVEIIYGISDVKDLTLLLEAIKNRISILSNEPTLAEVTFNKMFETQKQYASTIIDGCVSRCDPIAIRTVNDQIRFELLKYYQEQGFAGHTKDYMVHLRFK